MAIEVGSGEERRRFVLYQRLLVRLGRNPEHDDVAVALSGLRVDSIRSRIAEEDEGLPTHLVNRVITGAVLHGDMWHAQSQLVHVLDPRWLDLVVRHTLSVGCSPPALCVCEHPHDAKRSRGNRSLDPFRHRLGAGLVVENHYGVCKADVIGLLAPVATHEPWLLPHSVCDVSQLLRVQRRAYVPCPDDCEHMSLQIV
jgi:hypothetical protein